MRYQDAPSLSSLLPYHSMNEEIHFLRDGSLGVAWEILAPECEAASPDTLQQIATRMENLIRILPEGCALQFLMMADRCVQAPISRWQKATSEEGILSDIALARSRATAALSFRHDGVPVTSRMFRRFLTLRIWPQWPRPPILESFRKGSLDHRLQERYREVRNALREQAQAIENVLIPAGFSPGRLDQNAFMEIPFRILNPSRSKMEQPPRDNPDRLLREQAGLSGLMADFSDGSLHLDGRVLQILSAVDLPRETWPGMLELDRDVTILDLLPEALLVFNIEICRQESIRKFLSAKKRLAFCQLSSGDGRADMAAMKDEVDEVLHEMFVEGSRVLSARFHVLTQQEANSSSPSAANIAINALRRVGVEMIREDALAPTLFLQCLPLAYDPCNDHALKRGRRLLAPNLAHLLPVYGSLRGTSKPDLLLLNRRGQPVTFSFFDSESAPHGIIAGVSGSGKSVLANNIILSAARRGSTVFVMDRGNSYQKLCNLIGGTYITFDPNHPQSINPCGSVLSEEKTLFLADILSEMCAQGRQELSVKERSLITRAITRAFRGTEVLLSDIRNQLNRDESAAAHDLAICLEPFVDRGPYAGFFDRPRNVFWQGGLVVFELGEIAKRRDIGGVLLMTLLQAITEYCSLHLEQEKYLLVDEAWTLLQSDNTARFLEDVLRTYRKKNTSAIMITQQVADFDGRAGAAIRANAPNRIFLRQTPETILAMETLLDLSPEEKELLASLVTVKGKFSEMLILSPNSSGIARLIQDPLSYWISTSDPEDNGQLQAAIRKFQDRKHPAPLRAALMEMATRSA